MIPSRRSRGSHAPERSVAVFFLATSAHPGFSLCDSYTLSNIPVQILYSFSEQRKAHQRRYIDDYIENEKFLAYYMSISGHLNYTYNGNMMATKNRDKVKNLKYSEAIQAYLATNIELDKALESLINSLKEKGKLDDTVIVISADHYPYGLTINEMKERATYINDEKFDIHKNNLIIWNSQIKTPIKIDKYASSLDILPTVLNLLGVEYDSRLLMGTDILSNSEGLVIFNDRSWITKYGKYDAIKGKFTEYINLEEKQKYIDEINEIVKNKFNASRLILETNYYKYIKTEE